MGWEDQKKIEMGFGELVRRLFEPVWGIKLIYFKWFVQALSFFLFDIYTVLVFKYIWEYIQENNTEWMKETIVLYIIVFILFYFWKYYVRHWWRAIWKPTIRNSIMQDVLEKFYRLEQSVLEKLWTWKVSHILDSGVQHWADVLMDIQYSFTEFVVKLAFTLYLVFALWWWYGLWFISFMILWSIIITIANKYAIKRRKLRKEEEITLSRNFIRNIMARQEVILANKQQFERSWIAKILDRILWFNIQVNHNLFIMFNAPILLVQWFIVILLIHTYLSIIGDTFSFGTFTALVGMSGYLIPLMLTSTNTFKEMTENFIHIEKLWELFDKNKKTNWYDQWNKFSYSRWSIEIKNVTFSYWEENNQSPQVFSQFNLIIDGWKKTALVGMSGSGKSTLIKLIAWYLMPDEGKVLVDGQDLTTVALQSYFAHIGYLTQEPSVFDGTIRENLEYGMIEGSKDTTKLLDQAVRLAKCDFINDLPNWLDTEIGERGIRLSGGQRQRLAIAKIFLKDPKIVLLDEPTSALDSFAEEAVTEAMENLFKGRTVIIIAHRLQTVKHADDIIVIDHGKVIERWRHDDLVCKGWYYARMLELQSGF
jgi:ATP-binding cassette subfamily B protein